MRPIDDTIVAISTPDGRGALGVVRVSGPEAWRLAARLIPAGLALEDRCACFSSIRTLEGEVLDQVVATPFKGPASYTGEDVVEISAHGNPMILKAIMVELVRAGARPAGPGEFTLRAVAHGKLDLAQAEAVRDFIDAQTQAQARTAMAQLEGAAAKQARPIRDRLVSLIARLEAGIDFSDDDVDLPPGRAIRGEVDQMREAVRREMATFEYGRLLGGGLRLAVAGRPNVGKSSIFNRLCGTARAIVTDIPGTTRDVLTETVEIEGVPIRLADTAGIRATTEPVEAIGISRALETLAESDFSLIVLDLSRELGPEDRELLDRAWDRPHLVVLNKQDLPHRWEVIPGHPSVRTSAHTGDGVEAVRAAIAAYIRQGKPDGAEDSFVANLRQRDALAAADERLTAAAEALDRETPHEFVLLDLYSALEAVGALTGEVVTDDILDVIFSTFCIGK